MEAMFGNLCTSTQHGQRASHSKHVAAKHCTLTYTLKKQQHSSISESLICVMYIFRP